jgi:hypothetical protein
MPPTQPTTRTSVPSRTSDQAKPAARCIPTAHALCIVAALSLLTGCRRAPSYSILGSFFPVWIFCGVFGILLSFLTHLTLVRTGRENALRPPLLVYPALAALCCLTLWLLLFS